MRSPMNLIEFTGGALCAVGADGNYELICDSIIDVDIALVEDQSTIDQRVFHALITPSVNLSLTVNERRSRKIIRFINRQHRLWHIYHHTKSARIRKKCLKALDAYFAIAEVEYK